MTGPESVFEAEIRAFEEADRKDPPPPGEIVFVGSSTFTFWYNVSSDFRAFRIINRGFGGSELDHSILYADRIVTPYAPRQVVLYAGDNDIGGGKPAALVARDFRRFAELVHESVPAAMVTFLSIKPSFERWHLDDEIRDANRRIEAYAGQTDRISFIDTYHPSLTEDGELRPEIYIEDGLHLNRKGYRLWASVITPYLLPPVTGHDGVELPGGVERQSTQRQ